MTWESAAQSNLAVARLGCDGEVLRTPLNGRPAEITVRRWLNEGKVPGRKVGGTWYVDEHAWMANGNDLVLRVLNNS